MGVGLVYNLLYNMNMNFINKNWNKLVLIAYSLIIPVVSFADNTNCDPTQGKICNPLGGSSGTVSIPAFIQTLLMGALKLGIPVVALAIIYSGFLFVAARGNSEKLTKAKDTLLYTVIGAAILLGAWAIAQMISATINGLAS